MALTDLGSNWEELTKDSLSKVVKEYSSGMYFLLKMEAADENTPVLKFNLTSENDYYNRIRYLTAEINQDIQLITTLDTSYVTHHVFERAYGLRPYEQVLFHFDKEPLDSEDVEIQYSGLFTAKKERFKFNSTTIIKIPKLKI